MGPRIHSSIIWFAVVVGVFVCQPANSELVVHIQKATVSEFQVPFKKIARFNELDGTPRGNLLEESIPGDLGYYLGQGAFGPDGSYHFMSWGMGFNSVSRVNWPSSTSAATYWGSMMEGAPGTMSFAPSGRLLVSVLSNSTYRAWVSSPTNWTLLKAYRTPASGPTHRPVGIVSPSDSQMILVDSQARFFSGDPSLSGQNGLFTEELIATIDSTSGQATYAYGLTNVAVGGMALGPDGNLYVSDINTHSILRIDPRGHPGLIPSLFFMGTFVSSRAGGLEMPTHLAFGSDGHLFVYSSADRSILRFHPTTGMFERRLLQLPVGEFATSLAFSPPVPELVQKKTGESVHLEWSSQWTNYVLQGTSNPADLVSWTNIAALPSTNGPFLSLTNSWGSDRGFFRLRRMD